MTKLRLLFFGFLAVFCIVILRLFYIQVLHPDLQKDYLSTRKLQPERGKIFDRNGQPIVMNQILYHLFFEPKLIKDSEKTASKLAEILKVSEASISARIDPTKTWTSVYGGISKQDRDTILNLGLPGLGFDEQWSRYYPDASIAAHLAGFVGKNDEGIDVGRSGVEGFYDKDLGGLPGLIRSDLDLEGRPIFLGTQERIDPENGRDLYLTIDKSVQMLVKEKLSAGLEKYEAKEGCAIVANPNTMEILALSCLPDYDPDTYYKFNNGVFRDAAISDAYEPGSTFKPLVMAAGIEAGVIKPDTMFNEDGPVKIGEYTIRTWNNSYEGNITLTRALEKSSNVGMVFVGSKLGNDRLYDSIIHYGFGSETHIDLEGEAAGFLKPKKEWYPIDYATATFGQGLAVTPIQMITAFSSIINGGKLMKPYVVKELRGEGIQKVDPIFERQLISQKTSDAIKLMLLSTIENGETKYLAPKGYQIGGKTGTAQIPIEGHYDATKTIASFIGFSPIKNPQFIGLVIVKEPKSSQWGSETAAPIFFEIAKELIVYYNISPK
jgi:cell division protein FtsI/penicillin-binding protein 2